MYVWYERLYMVLLHSKWAIGACAMRHHDRIMMPIWHQVCYYSSSFMAGSQYLIYYLSGSAAVSVTPDIRRAVLFSWMFVRKITQKYANRPKKSVNNCGDRDSPHQIVWETINLYNRCYNGLYWYWMVFGVLFVLFHYIECHENRSICHISESCLPRHLFSWEDNSSCRINFLFSGTWLVSLIWLPARAPYTYKLYILFLQVIVSLLALTYVCSEFIGPVRSAKY